MSTDAAVYPVPRPFVVIATQNPIDLEGTYVLPEAQLDRFLMRLEDRLPVTGSGGRGAADRAGLAQRRPPGGRHGPRRPARHDRLREALRRGVARRSRTTSSPSAPGPGSCQRSASGSPLVVAWPCCGRPGWPPPRPAGPSSPPTTCKLMASPHPRPPGDPPPRRGDPGPDSSRSDRARAVQAVPVPRAVLR